MSLKSFLLSFGFATVLAMPAIAQDTEALDRDLDQAIQSACHSFMIDALPDALAWLRTEIYENSPFCQRIQNAGDLEAFGAVVQDTLTRLNEDDVRLDLSQKQDRDLNVTIECDSEYMCMEIRLAFQETATPVAQADYEAVQAYCDGRYGCIQAYFADWPAPLPVPTRIADAEMIRFDEIVTYPVPGTSVTRSDATDGTTIEQDPAASAPSGETAASQTIASSAGGGAPGQPAQESQAEPTQIETTQARETQPEQAAAPEAVPAASQDVFIMGPNQGWREAGEYCAGLGRRLPTVDEARDLLELIPRDGGPANGLWTSEANYVDDFVQHYNVMRRNGFTLGQDAAERNGVACVK